MSDVKMMSPRTTITWYPVNGFANALTPTVIELNAGTNLSAAIVTGYTLNFTDSDTDDSKTIVDEANVQNRGFSNYEASLSFFRDADAASPTIFTTALALFEGTRATGYLVSRQGKKNTEAYAAGDHISIFKVMSSEVTSVEGEGGVPIQVAVPFHPQGEAFPNYLVA